MTRVRHQIGEEVYGGPSGGGRNLLYSEDPHQIIIVGVRSTWLSLSDAAKVVFLPQGYPESVSKDYFKYQLWDTLQAFVSTLMGTIATHAVLKGVGVGDQMVTPISAAITWVLRDGISMLGRIVFAWQQGSSLDCNSKQWRLFADLMNDVAICFDLMAAYFGSFSMTIICIAGFLRSFVGVAGSATRAAFVQHQARRNNLADVAAKDGSQETLVNLSGLIISLIFLPIITNNDGLLWLCYFLFATLHLTANYNAVRSIVMETLNQSRLSILVEHFLENPTELCGLEETNLKENLILGEDFGKIYLGCSLGKTVSQYEEFQRIKSLYTESQYLLNMNTFTKKVFVTLHKNSNNLTLLESSFQAQLLLYYFRKGTTKMAFEFMKSSRLRPPDKTNSGNKLHLLKWSHEITKKHFTSFVKMAEIVGWDLSHSLLGADEWRAVWYK